MFVVFLSPSKRNGHRVKVKLTLKQATKAQMYSSTLPSTSALDGDGWSTPRPGRFNPRERPGTHCTGGWVGPRAGLDGCGKSRSPPGFDPRTVQPLESHHTDCANPASAHRVLGNRLRPLHSTTCLTHYSPYVVHSTITVPESY